MRYNSYRQTEIPWVDAIPSHWDQIRNGGLFDYHQDKVGDRYSEYQLLSLTTQGIRCKDIHDVSGKVPASYDNYQEVNTGDMVFCLFDLDCSAVFSGLSKYHGMITSAYDVMKPKDGIVNERFLDYWYQSVFAGRYYKIFAKSVRYTINYDIFKAIKTPVPPRKEQDQIVRYLDWQTSKINKLIHGYQRQIKLLEEAKNNIITKAVLHGTHDDVQCKESGSKWIENIPVHWDCLRGKYLFHEIDYRSESGDEELLSVSHITGITPRSQKNVTMFKSESLVGYKLCDIGDIAGNTMWMWAGAVGVSSFRGVVSPSYNLYRQNNGAYVPQYLDYLLRTPNLIDNYVVLSTGIRKSRLRLYPDKFLGILYPVPPIEEQKEILDYIEKQTDTYNNNISNIETEIDLLREYRTRLISDVVTGQMDVRGIEIPDYTPEDDIEDSEAENETVDEEVDADAE